MSSKLFDRSREYAKLLSLVRDVAQHTLECSKPVRHANHNEYEMGFDLGKGLKAKAVYRIFDKLYDGDGRHRFELIISDKKIFLVRGDSLDSIKFIDHRELNPTTRMKLEQYIHKIYGEK
jgi:hypothetical protein